MAIMDATAQVRWFHLTPGRFVIGLLAVEVLLWASERFGWLGCMLTTNAVADAALLDNWKGQRALPSTGSRQL
jgi:hypothetical protein